MGCVTSTDSLARQPRTATSGGQDILAAIIWLGETAPALDRPRWIWYAPITCCRQVRRLDIDPPVLGAHRAAARLGRQGHRAGGDKCLLLSHQAAQGCRSDHAQYAVPGLVLTSAPIFAHALSQPRSSEPLDGVWPTRRHKCGLQLMPGWASQRACRAHAVWRMPLTVQAVFLARVSQGCQINT